MKAKENALTSREDLPSPKLIKRNEVETTRLKEEFSALVEEQADSIESAKEESFYLRSTLIALRKLLSEGKITPKTRAKELMAIMEDRLSELSDLSSETRDMDLEKINNP